MRLIASIGLALSMAAGTVRAENWPNWRGPGNDGICAETGIPLTWSDTENVVWKLRLPGPGGATPAVWEDRIFLTAAEESELVLLCIDTAGKQLWRQVMGTGNKVVRGDEGNSASPSPTTDGKHVWAFMATGDLGCYDFEGKEIWKYNLQDKYGKFDIQFGMTSSPVLDKDRLYVQCMYTGASYVVALNKMTGEEIWKYNRTSDAYAECEHSYASPMLYRDGEREYLLSHGADYIVAHSLEDGKELFRCGGLNPRDNYNPTLRFVASPLAIPGMIVVPSAKNGPVVALKPTSKGDVSKDTQSQYWFRKDNTPDVPSPLVKDGLLYLCRENGDLICMDAQTGEEHYTQRTHRHRHRSSPVYLDGHILLTSRDGIISVVKAGPNFELVASNNIGESISASPAISNGRIYLRGFDTLFAIGK